MLPRGGSGGLPQGALDVLLAHAELAGEQADIDAALYPVGQFGNERRDLVDDRRLAAPGGRVARRDHRVDDVVEQRLGGGDQRRPRGWVGADELVRVLAGRHTEDVDLHGEAALRADEAARIHLEIRVVAERAAQGVHRPQHRQLPRRVGIEGEDDARRQFLDEADLLLGERRAHRRDDIAVAELMRRQRIHIPLDDHHFLLLADGIRRAVDGVEQVALVEERGLRRIEVFRLLIVAQRPPAEAHHFALPVADREDEPATEAVVRAVAALALREQADGERVLQIVAPPAQVARQRLPFVRRVAELELLGDFVRDAALGESRCGPAAPAGGHVSRF